MLTIGEGYSSARIIAEMEQKKSPMSHDRGFSFGSAHRTLAAGQLGQPSLQWDTGRILNLSIHILWVSFRRYSLLINRTDLILKQFENLSNYFFDRAYLE